MASEASRVGSEDPELIPDICTDWRNGLHGVQTWVPTETFTFPEAERKNIYLSSGYIHMNIYT